MNHAIATHHAPETKWTVVRGPMKGVVKLMSQSQFYIGRSTECEFVVVNDPKCSRKHALITLAATGLEVVSQNDKNLVLVNGKEIERKVLKDGDILTLGETEIQYNSTARRMEQAQMAVVRPGHGQYMAAGHPAQMAAARPGRAVKLKKSASPRLVIYFVLAIFALFIFTPNKSKKKTVDIRTEKQIEEDIAQANKLREAAESDQIKKLDQSVTAKQAQENYVRGFRDYKKGQFERSLVSFQACLALNPEHVLCNRYSRLAQRRFDELIQAQVVDGRRCRDQSQYRCCRSAFKNVMVMVKDSNSQVFKEAKANYEACNAFVEGRF